MYTAPTCEVVAKVQPCPKICVLAGKMDSQRRTKLLPHSFRFGQVRSQSDVLGLFQELFQLFRQFWRTVGKDNAVVCKQRMRELLATDGDAHLPVEGTEERVQSYRKDSIALLDTCSFTSTDVAGIIKIFGSMLQSVFNFYSRSTYSAISIWYVGYRTELPRSERFL